MLGKNRSSLMRRVACLLFLGLMACFGPVCLKAQSYAPLDVLEVPVDASLAVLGDYNVSHTSATAASMWQNPAWVADTTSMLFGFSYADQPADIWGLALAYQFAIATHRLGVGIRHLNYGAFDGYDEYGRETAPFSSALYLFSISYAHRLGPVALGASLLPSYSFFVDRHQGRLFADLGATFTHPRHELRLGVVLKHLPLLGSSARGTPMNRSDPPVDLWIGATWRPQEMPFRFSLSSHGLLQTLVYHDPNSAQLFHRERGTLFARMLNHLVPGMEFVLGSREQLVLQIAYVLSRRQLATDEASGLAGFAFGTRIRLSWMQLQLVRSFHDIRGGRTQLGMQLELSAMRRPVRRSSASE